MIDNLDGRGAQDYTPFLDGAKSPRVLRKLNRPAELQVSLVTGEGSFVVPVAGRESHWAGPMGPTFLRDTSSAARLISIWAGGNGVRCIGMKSWR